MTEDQTPSRDNRNVWIIVLAVVATVLLGAIIGYVATGGLSDDPTAESPVGTTTTQPPPVVSTVPPSTSVPETPPVTDAPGQMTIQATEDTYTDASDPEDTSGFDDVLELEEDPPDVKAALLRFDATGVPAGEAIEGVTLRLFVMFSSGAAIEVHSVEGSWSETDTNANSAPAIGGLIATIPGGVVEGEVVEVELAGQVAVPGTVDLYLTTSGDDTIEIASKESGANAPALIVRWTP